MDRSIESDNDRLNDAIRSYLDAFICDFRDPTAETADERKQCLSKLLSLPAPRRKTVYRRPRAISVMHLVMLEDQMSLTLRELEVLAIRISGCTIRETAKALFLSPKTIESHLAHIYSKLGTSNQARIAIWLYRIGLVGYDDE